MQQEKNFKSFNFINESHKVRNDIRQKNHQSKPQMKHPIMDSTCTLMRNHDMNF